VNFNNFFDPEEESDESIVDFLFTPEKRRAWMIERIRRRYLEIPPELRTYRPPKRKRRTPVL
jgi:hypothetical protein